MADGPIAQPRILSSTCTALSRIRLRRKAKGGNFVVWRRDTGGGRSSSSRSGHTFPGPGSSWSTASTVTS